MDRQRIIRSARRLEPADLVLAGGRVVNVFTGGAAEADLAITDGVIVGLGSYEGRERLDISGCLAAPGFIDPHLHLESTMLSPGRLAEVLSPRGTTAVVADPHEIANVLGLDGVRLLIDLSRDLPVDFLFMAPSCVPATHLETAGAALTADDLAALRSEPRVLGLAEVMNFPGVLAGDREVLAKIDIFAGRPIDGHAPLLSGPDLAAYLAAGIGTDHECTRLDEAEEKLAGGMRIFIREGSQAQNLADLLPLVRPETLRRISFCTDDRHPEDLVRRGHLDWVIGRAVSLGLDPIQALTMATINPAETYRLNRRGALAPGYRADVVVLRDEADFRPWRVYKNGRLVAEDGRCLVSIPETSPPDWASPMNLGPLDQNRLEVHAESDRVRVIGLIENQILTEHLVLDAPASDGRLTADPDRDLARLMVFERHHGSGRIGQGLVRGLGLKTGALASSVAHDSHNVIAVGADPADLVCAVEAVAASGGGLAVAVQGRIIAHFPLPLAGLMTDVDAETAAAADLEMQKAAANLGCRGKNPFMALSFLALPVIPSLKLTDRGLVDVDRFDYVPLFA